MQLTIGWIQIAAAAGALQGVLLASVLLSHETNRTANRLLAALMIAFTVYLVEAVYYTARLVGVYPHLFGISYPLPWLFGPLVYLYAVAASGSRPLRARDVLHFAPAVIVVVASLPIYMMSGADKAALFARLQLGDVPTVLRVLDPTKYVSGIAYSVATIEFLRRHRRRVEHSYSNTEHVNLQWLLQLAAAAAAIWLLAVAAMVANRVRDAASGGDGDPVVLAIALFVYAIGYRGLRQAEIRRLDDPATEPPPEGDRVLGPRESPGRIDARYVRSGLSDSEAAALRANLLSIMDAEHPYRDPDLTLADLAERLDTTPHKLSEVLNGELAQTFYDFVNGYRVDDVRRRLAEAKSRQANVLALAMDAGFSSKSTFNQVFKKRTGQTPSMYRKALIG